MTEPEKRRFGLITKKNFNIQVLTEPPFGGNRVIVTAKRPQRLPRIFIERDRRQSRFFDNLNIHQTACIPQ